MPAAPPPTWIALDHVELAIPPGSEQLCRDFYVGTLGMVELQKPPLLAKRGGMWLRAGDAEIHLGVDEDFHPAKKAHPALFVGDLDALAARLSADGHEVTWDQSRPDRRRFYVHDAVGNRLEMIQAPD